MMNDHDQRFTDSVVCLQCQHFIDPATGLPRYVHQPPCQTCIRGAGGVLCAADEAADNFLDVAAEPCEVDPDQGSLFGGGTE